MKRIICLFMLFITLFSLTSCKPKFEVIINNDVKEFKAESIFETGVKVTATILNGGYTEVDKNKISIYANIKVEIENIIISKYLYIELVDGEGNVLKTNIVFIGSNLSKGTHIMTTEFYKIEIKETTYTVRIKPE